MLAGRKKPGITVDAWTAWEMVAEWSSAWPNAAVWAVFTLVAPM